MENESHQQHRIFGSAISQVQQQRPVPVGSSSVQVPAKKGRRSVFDRMDVVPTLGPVDKQRAMSREAQYKDVVVVADNEYCDNNNKRLMDYRRFPYRTASSSTRGSRPTTTTTTYSERWMHDLYDGDRVGSRVFVRNIPKGISTRTLHSLFSTVGEVVGVNIDKGPLTTATISFVRKDSADKAHEKYHGVAIGGSKIKVAVMENEEDLSKKISENDRNMDEDFVMGGTGSRELRSFLPNDTPRKSIFQRMI